MLFLRLADRLASVKKRDGWTATNFQSRPRLLNRFPGESREIELTGNSLAEAWVPASAGKTP